MSTVSLLNDETASEDVTGSLLSRSGILKTAIPCFCGTLMNCISCHETKFSDHVLR